MEVSLGGTRFFVIGKSRGISKASLRRAGEVRDVVIILGADSVVLEVPLKTGLAGETTRMLFELSECFATCGVSSYTSTLASFEALHPIVIRKKSWKVRE
jgi:hypothetical protein